MSRVDEVLAGTITAAALGAEAWALYSKGFEDAVAKYLPLLEDARFEAALWYEAAHFTPAQVADMRRKRMERGDEERWADIVAGRAVLHEVPPPDPTAAWPREAA